MSKYLVAVSYSHSKIKKKLQQIKITKAKFQPTSQRETQRNYAALHSVSIDFDKWEKQGLLEEKTQNHRII